jgi:hypothetical protein
MGDPASTARRFAAESRCPGCAVRAVDEGEALLFLEHHRLDTRGGKRLGGRDEGTLRVTNLALSEECKRTVCERCEVARAAEAAVFVHDGRDAGVQHGDVGFCDHRANPRAAGRESG